MPKLSTEEQAWPARPLSFDLVREVFSYEYSRRFERFVARGGQPQPVAAPVLEKGRLGD